MMEYQPSFGNQDLWIVANVSTGVITRYNGLNELTDEELPPNDD